MKRKDTIDIIRLVSSHCFRFACSAEAVLPIGLRLECKGIVACLSVSLSLKLLGQRLRRRPDWREAVALSDVVSESWFPERLREARKQSRSRKIQLWVTVPHPKPKGSWKSARTHGSRHCYRLDPQTERSQGNAGLHIVIQRNTNRCIQSSRIVSCVTKLKFNLHD